MSREWSPGAGRMIEVEVLEPLRPVRTRAPKQPSGGVWMWATVALTVLTDRRHDGIYPARTRLLLYLQIKSHGGKWPVRLTNQMAAAIGLCRQEKMVCLQHLEAGGYVTVKRGPRAPIVTFCKIAPP